MSEAAAVAFRIDADAWLADIMARPVYRVGLAGDGAAADFTAPGFYYAKLPIEAVAAANRLETAGFRYVDVAVSLEAPAVPAGKPDRQVRSAQPSDRDAVAALARRAFIWSRFHQDPLVPAAVANEVKSRWAGNFFTGERGDHMAVAEADGAVAGFLQLLRDAAGRLVIDLVAVDAAQRGRGLAAAMIAYAQAEWGGEAGMRVGTQMANRASLDLYQRLGFRLNGASLIFHKHSSREQQ